MANTITATTVLEGDRQAVIHVFVQGDGSTGDEAGAVVVDVSALAKSKHGDAVSAVKLEKVVYDLHGFSARLETGGSSPTTYWSMAAEQNGCADFRCFGGLQLAATSNPTYDIELATQDLLTTSDQGTIVIFVKKEY